MSSRGAVQWTVSPATGEPRRTIRAITEACATLRWVYASALRATRAATERAGLGTSLTVVIDSEMLKLTQAETVSLVVFLCICKYNLI